MRSAISLLSHCTHVNLPSSDRVVYRKDRVKTIGIGNRIVYVHENSPRSFKRSDLGWYNVTQEVIDQCLDTLSWEWEVS